MLSVLCTEDDTNKREDQPARDPDDGVDDVLDDVVIHLLVAEVLGPGTDECCSRCQLHSFQNLRASNYWGEETTEDLHIGERPNFVLVLNFRTVP